MRYFIYYYLYDSRLKEVQGGPMKVFDLCDNLVRLGHDVVLFAPDIGCPEKQTAARVVKIPAFGVPGLGILWHELCSFAASLRELAGGRCDAVYVRITTSFVPWLVSRLSGASLFTDVNDDPFYRYAATRGAGRLKLPLVRFADAFNLRRSDRVFTINGELAKALSDKLAIPAGKVEVMMSGTNTELFRPLDRGGACAELSLDPAFRYLCFAGSCNHWNDYGLLAEVVSRIARKAQDIRCLIVGDMGEERASAMVAGGAAGKFIMVGRVPPREAAKYMACAEVCLAPLMPDWGSMTSVKIFDYLACGRPVVASRPPGAENVFSDCPAVVPVPAGDAEAFLAAVEGLLADPERAARLGLAAREFAVKNYDRRAAASRLAALAEALR